MLSTNVMTKQTHPYVSPVPSTFDFIFLTSTHLPALLNVLRSPSCEANDKHNYLLRPKKNTVRLPGLWAGLSKGDCYLPGIHPTEGTSSCV